MDQDLDLLLVGDECTPRVSSRDGGHGLLPPTYTEWCCAYQLKSPKVQKRFDGSNATN